MTGPEHYKAAEYQAEISREFRDEGRAEQAEYRLQLAQVHATLALTAAIALQHHVNPWNGRAAEERAWTNTIVSEPAPDSGAER